ncbi:hypothetical protein FA13DRAFT_1797160 [Coprinellus micaceus]|uniref:Uncharacterized protein n=1 Tax=Coprinellus micaceus TaxID=71717 RepID=A0A4Y7SSK3_COPMI|nr:hypothetical protein FA13DRAFT_1797160 [Coprinellus micaceus]
MGLDVDVDPTLSHFIDNAHNLHHSNSNSNAFLPSYSPPIRPSVDASIDPGTPPRGTYSTPKQNHTPTHHRASICLRTTYAHLPNPYAPPTYQSPPYAIRHTPYGRTTAPSPPGPQIHARLPPTHRPA